MADSVRYVLHCFRPSETIDAVFRLKGRHNLTKEEMLQLRERFNELNGAVVPRPGQTFKIPLPNDSGYLENVSPDPHR